MSETAPATPDSRYIVRIDGADYYADDIASLQQWRSLNRLPEHAWVYHPSFVGEWKRPSAVLGVRKNVRIAVALVLVAGLTLLCGAILVVSVAAFKSSPMTAADYIRTSGDLLSGLETKYLILDEISREGRQMTEQTRYANAASDQEMIARVGREFKERSAELSETSKVAEAKAKEAYSRLQFASGLSVQLDKERQELLETYRLHESIEDILTRAEKAPHPKSKELFALAEQVEQDVRDRIAQHTSTLESLRRAGTPTPEEASQVVPTGRE